jgi:hypothetical protein
VRQKSVASSNSGCVGDYPKLLSLFINAKREVYSLIYEHEVREGQIAVTRTSFEDPSGFSPPTHIWVEDKLPWVTINDGLPPYAQWVVPD